MLNLLMRLRPSLPAIHPAVRPAQAADRRAFVARAAQTRAAQTRAALPQILPLALLLPLILVLASCRHHDFPTYPANYREYLYVANSGSNTVSAIDVVHLRLDREIAVGIHPVAVLAAHQHPEVFVLNSGDPANRTAAGSLSILNAQNQMVAATLPAGRAPRAFALDPEDRFAYVASTGSSSLVVLDLLHHRIAAELPLHAVPDQVAVAPDGRSILVSSAAAGSLLVLDANPAAMHWTMRAQFGGCPGADSLAILPDSSKAFVACSHGHQIMAVQLAWQADPHLGRTDTRTDALEALLNVGQAPGWLALKPDGGELFVSNTGSNSISEVVTSSDDVGGSYLIGSAPGFGIVSADNSLLYVSSLQSQQIAVYGIDDGRRLGAIHVGDGPDRMAFSAAGHLLFAIDRRSGDVAAVRTDTRSLFTLLSVGREPIAIADKSFLIP